MRQARMSGEEGFSDIFRCQTSRVVLLCLKWVFQKTARVQNQKQAEGNVPVAESNTCASQVYLGLQLLPPATLPQREPSRRMPESQIESNALSRYTMTASCRDSRPARTAFTPPASPEAIIEMGDGVHRGLWERMQTLTARRLTFDRKMREKAVHSVAQQGSISNVSHGDDSGRPASPVRSTIERTNRKTSVHNDERQQSDGHGVLSLEGRVTYMKFQADQLLHIAEMSHTCSDGNRRGLHTLAKHEGGGLALKALKSYMSAQRAAMGESQIEQHPSQEVDVVKGDAGHAAPSLPEFHPLRLELALRISTVLFNLLGRPYDAWEVAYPVYTAAAECPACLGPRSLAMAQILRDHLASIDVARGRGCSPGGSYRGEADVGCFEGQLVRNHKGEGWSFLRVSAVEGDVDRFGAYGDTKSRAVAQVQHARECMEGVAKVLLGTMTDSNRILSTLEQIFEGYARDHPVQAVTYEEAGRNDSELNNNHNNTNIVWCQGRPVKRNLFAAHGPYLAWAGFQAMCDDFNIARIATSTFAWETPMESPDDDAKPSQPSQPQAHGATGSAAARNFLLAEIQIRVAFLTACMHGSVIASFPDTDGKVASEAAVDVAPSTGTVAGGMRSQEEEETYWKDMEERMADAPDSSAAMPRGAGLNFHRFVDALARCGLIGFSSPHGSDRVGGEAACNRAEWHAAAGLQDTCATPSKQVQALLTDRMRLLDDRHVENILSRRTVAVQANAVTSVSGHSAGCPSPRKET